MQRLKSISHHTTTSIINYCYFWYYYFPSLFSLLIFLLIYTHLISSLLFFHPTFLCFFHSLFHSLFSHFFLFLFIYAGNNVYVKCSQTRFNERYFRFLLSLLSVFYLSIHKNRSVHFLSVKFSIWNFVFGLDLNPCTLVCSKIESKWHALNGFANTQSAPASRNMLTSSLRALPVKPNINLSNPHFLIAVVASPPF